jgi:hypothetical protein
LRDLLAHDLRGATSDLFHFDGDRCDRVVANVMTRLSEAREQGGTPRDLTTHEPPEE